MATGIQFLARAQTATGAATAISGQEGGKTYQASGLTTAGAGAATVVIQGSNNGRTWDTIGTISLVLATTESSDSFTSTDRFVQVRSNVTALSGTGANVEVTMGY